MWKSGCETRWLSGPTRPAASSSNRLPSHIQQDHHNSREEELHNDQNGTGCPSEIRRRVTWREDWDGHRRESLGILLCSLVHKPLVIDSYDHPRGSISLCIYIYTHASVEGWSCEEYKCLGGGFYNLVCVYIIYIYICIYIYVGYCRVLISWSSGQEYFH